MGLDANTAFLFFSIIACSNVLSMKVFVYFRVRTRDWQLSNQFLVQTNQNKLYGKSVVQCSKEDESENNESSLPSEIITDQ